MSNRVDSRDVGRRPGRPSSRSADEAGAQTLRSGLLVLQEVASMGAPVSLSSVARQCGIPASRTHRYLKTLVQCGMLQHSDATGMYSLGPAAIQLGALATSASDPLQAATPFMRQLSAHTSLVCIAAVWGTHGPTVVRCERPNAEASVHIREGVNLSLLSTAAGSVFAAFMDPDLVHPYLERDMGQWNQTSSRERRLTWRKLQLQLAEIRERAMSQAIGVRNPLIATISVPIFDRYGIVMSLSLSGIRHSFDCSYEGAPASELRSAGAQLSVRLGHRISA